MTQEPIPTAAAAATALLRAGAAAGAAADGDGWTEAREQLAGRWGGGLTSGNCSDEHAKRCRFRQLQVSGVV